MGFVIIPITGGELDDWIADGRAIPATNHEPFRMPAGDVDPTADAGKLIRQLRNEERW